MSPEVVDGGMTSEDTDTSIVSAATETPIARPVIVVYEEAFQDSIPSYHRQLDFAAPCGRVKQNENHHIMSRLQLFHDNQ
jgi:hypothetical protein